SDESLSLQKVTIVKADENEQNLNRNHSSFTSKNKCKQHERPIKNNNSSDNEKHQMVLHNSSNENIIIQPAAKNGVLLFLEICKIVQFKNKSGFSKSLKQLFLDFLTAHRPTSTAKNLLSLFINY
ncbi:hypothetical protein LOAG_16093, partial [Loa loa]